MKKEKSTAVSHDNNSRRNFLKTAKLAMLGVTGVGMSLQGSEAAQKKPRGRKVEEHSI